MDARDRSLAGSAKAVEGIRQEPGDVADRRVARGCSRIGEGQPSRYLAAETLKDTPTPWETSRRLRFAAALDGA